MVRLVLALANVLCVLPLVVSGSNDERNLSSAGQTTANSNDEHETARVSGAPQNHHCPRRPAAAAAAAAASAAAAAAAAV
jgi:hypothetical protein